MIITNSKGTPINISSVSGTNIQYPVTITVVRNNYQYSGADYDTKTTVSLSSALPVDLTITCKIAKLDKNNLGKYVTHGFWWWEQTTEDLTATRTTFETRTVTLPAGSLSTAISASDGSLVEGTTYVAISFPQYKNQGICWCDTNGESRTTSKSIEFFADVFNTGYGGPSNTYGNGSKTSTHTLWFSRALNKGGI